MGSDRDDVVDCVERARARARGRPSNVAFDERDVLGGIDRRGIDLEIECAAEGALDLVSATTLTR